MRAVIYRGPLDLPTVDSPAPSSGPGDVIVNVRAAGMCGTDVRIFKGEHRAAVPGRVPGHEIVGTIAAGEPPEGLELGDPVFVAPNLGCGECLWCERGHENLCTAPEALGITLDGGFAEQVLVPARAVAHGNLIPVAPIDDDGLLALALAEPLACVLRGHDRIGGVHEGDTVLVMGAGPVGLLHIALAKASGASAVLCSQPSQTRRRAAIDAGATTVIDPTTDDLAERVDALTGGRGADVVVTAAPVHALQAQALELAAIRGRVLLFGGLPKSSPTVEMDTNLIHYKELLVTGTTASSVEDCRRAVALLESGVIDARWMVSHAFSVDDAVQAIAAAQDSTALKVVLTPNSEGRSR